MPMNIKCFTHVEDVNRLVLSSLLASIFGFVESPVDIEMREGHPACPKQASGLKGTKPQTPLTLALGACQNTANR